MTILDPQHCMLGYSQPSPRDSILNRSPQADTDSPADVGSLTVDSALFAGIYGSRSIACTPFVGYGFLPPLLPARFACTINTSTVLFLMHLSAGGLLMPFDRVVVSSEEIEQIKPAPNAPPSSFNRLPSPVPWWARIAFLCWWRCCRYYARWR